MKKILIADDSLFMRTILRSILTTMNVDYEILEADSGEDSLKKFRSEKPDLILLDIVMPEGEEEGVKVLQKIKAEDPDAMVIMITAIGQKGIIQDCLDSGATDYIVKPIDTEIVVQKVKKYLGEQPVTKTAQKIE